MEMRSSLEYLYDFYEPLLRHKNYFPLDLKGELHKTIFQGAITFQAVRLNSKIESARPSAVRFSQHGN